MPAGQVRTPGWHPAALHRKGHLPNSPYTWVERERLSSWLASAEHYSSLESTIFTISSFLGAYRPSSAILLAALAVHHEPLGKQPALLLRGGEGGSIAGDTKVVRKIQFPNAVPQQFAQREPPPPCRKESRSGHLWVETTRRGGAGWGGV